MMNQFEFMGRQLQHTCPETAGEVLDWQVRIMALAHHNAERFLMHGSQWLANYCPGVNFEELLVPFTDQPEKLCAAMGSFAVHLISEAGLPPEYTAELDILLRRLAEIEGKPVPKVDPNTFDGISNFVMNTHGDSRNVGTLDLGMPWWAWQLAVLNRRVDGTRMAIEAEGRKQTDQYNDIMDTLKGIVPG